MEKYLSKQQNEELKSLPIPLCIYVYHHGELERVLMSDAAVSLLSKHVDMDSGFNFNECINLVHIDDKLTVIEFFKSVLEDDTNDHVRVFRCRKKQSREYSWMTIACWGVKADADTKIIFASYNDANVLNQMTLEENLTHRRTENLLSLILKTTQTAIFWKDDNRRFLGANKAFIDYYGFKSEDDILGKTDEDMGWHSDPDPFKNDELRVIEKGETTYRVSGHCIAQNEERDIVASKAPMYENGKIIGLVGSFEDVTAETKQREEIDKLNQQLILALDEAKQANQIKSEFMAQMRHDMRAPLTAAIGLCDLAIQDAHDSRDDDYFKKIRESSDYLLSILNDILDVQKLETGKMTLDLKVHDIDKIIQSVNNIVVPLVNHKGIDYRCDFDVTNQIFAIVDGKKLEQILINIINNAIKYTPASGRVEIKINVMEEADAYQIQFVISDNGVGMSEAFQTRMYDAFSKEVNSQTQSESGTGLGLSIVKNMIDIMQGNITCVSKLDEGTTFTIDLSFEKATPEQIATYEASHHHQNNKVDLKDKRILLCEDVAINAEIVQKILMNNDIICEWAPNGLSGVEMARHNHYDAILMDIRMPVMNGIDAAKAIRGFDTKIPIIALSANAHNDDIKMSFDAGMNAHLPKPINIQELLETLKEYIDA